jgi:hypothetical protein
MEGRRERKIWHRTTVDMNASLCVRLALISIIVINIASGEGYRGVAPRVDRICAHECPTGCYFILPEYNSFRA